MRCAAPISELRPEIVFHLAAQSLVRQSYDEPVETYATNVMGTAHVLEAVRARPDGPRRGRGDQRQVLREPRVAVGLSRGRGDGRPRSLQQPKGCAELVTAAYRRSFFSGPGNRAVGVATARAGNVIGGGDWARGPPAARLHAGARRAARPVPIRNPHAVRPWQHVLEPLCGYLRLAERLDADRRWLRRGVELRAGRMRRRGRSDGSPIASSSSGAMARRWQSDAAAMHRMKPPR